MYVHSTKTIFHTVHIVSLWLLQATCKCVLKKLVNMQKYSVTHHHHFDLDY